MNISIFFILLNECKMIANFHSVDLNNQKKIYIFELSSLIFEISVMGKCTVKVVPLLGSLST
jgi:hypothetical protein